MSGYHGSPAGYLNPVAVDRIQHPDFDARVAENTVMRTIQYLYPIIHDYMIMLKGLCEETEVQLPTELDDNICKSWNLLLICSSLSLSKVNPPLGIREANSLCASQVLAPNATSKVYFCSFGFRLSFP